MDASQLARELTRELIQKHGSVNAAAKACRMSPSHLWMIKKGIRKQPTMETLQLMAAGLGQPLHKLVEAAEDRPERPFPKVGMMSFREWLRELKAKGGRFGSERKMAREFGVTQPTIHFWLSGQRLPDLDFCSYVSEATGEDLGYIVEMVRQDARQWRTDFGTWVRRLHERETP